MLKIKYFEKGQMKFGLFEVKNRGEFAMQMGKDSALNSEAFPKDNPMIAFGLFTIVAVLLIILTNSFLLGLIVFAFGCKIGHEMDKTGNKKIKAYNKSRIEP